MKNYLNATKNKLSKAYKPKLFATLLIAFMLTSLCATTLPTDAQSTSPPIKTQYESDNTITNSETTPTTITNNTHNTNNDLDNTNKQTPPSDKATLNNTPNTEQNINTDQTTNRLPNTDTTTNNNTPKNNEDQIQITHTNVNSNTDPIQTETKQPRFLDTPTYTANAQSENPTPRNSSIGTYNTGDLIAYETTYTVPINTGFIDTLEIFDNWNPANSLNLTGYTVELNGNLTTTGFNVTNNIGQNVFTFDPAIVPANTTIKLILYFTITSTTKDITNKAAVYINSYYIGSAEAALYTVTYDANWPTATGTTGTAPIDNQLYASGVTVTVLGNIGNLTAEGYTFGGWLYNGTIYQANDTFTMPANNVTLAAVWNPIILNSSFSVTKITCPTDSETTFNFATTATPGTFSLKNGETWNSGDLPPGNYTLTESPQSGWTISNIIIDGITNYTMNSTTGTIRFTLEANQHATIIYQNAEQSPLPGSFSVTKVTCPAGSSTPFTFVTSALFGTFNLTDGEVWISGNLSPGIYFVTELAQAGWELSNIIVIDPSGCSMVDLSTGTVILDLQAGSQVNILYQNTQQPPHPDCCKNPCECKPCCECNKKPCECKPCCECNKKPCECKPCCECNKK
ncbi:MAG: InlB B-repeat-containing protein, partial [Nitrososphaerota archaeon]|nr:InlB B-repeat-containing protein [Nitrososphaerota archaeon]